MSQEWRFISIEKKLRREKQKSEPFIVNLYLSNSVVFLMYVTMLCQLRAARLHLLDPYQQEGTDPCAQIYRTNPQGSIRNPI